VCHEREGCCPRVGEGSVFARVTAWEMEDCWPSGAALWGEASKHLKLHWLTTVVVSVEEKASLMTPVGDREGELSSPLMKHRKQWLASKPGRIRGPGMESGGYPLTGQAMPGVNGGTSPICGFHAERGRARPDTARGLRARGSAPSGGNREVPSTVAGRAVGPVHSSGEVSVMGAERRGRTVR
jgi:hypothetical protein